MSIPGERLIVYFIDQLVQEVKKKKKLLDGVEGEVDLLEGNLGVINAYLKDSEREHHDHEGNWMATKVEVINQMREIVSKAERVIDEYIYHKLIQKRRNWVVKSIHSNELVDIAKTIAAKKKEMEEIYKNRERILQQQSQQQQQQQQQQAAAALLAADYIIDRRRTVENKDAVGLDGHTNEWVKNLTNLQYPKRDVLIMGMGGLGKSKLARKIYDRINVAAGGHFHCWAWVYGSPEFKTRDWLVKILESMQTQRRRYWPLTALLEQLPTTNNNGIDHHEIMDVEKLADTLNKRLQGKRYLIVLDGMWKSSSNEWKAIEPIFPDDRNGSRILITCREGVLTTDSSSPNQYCALPLLNGADSWTLLCNRVFPGGRCDDRKLEVEGKALAADCKGLPLSVIVLGELLCENVLPGFTHSVKTWEGYRQHVNSILIRKPTRCLSVLAESYLRLPDPQLQSCFLYLSLFPEDFVYSARHLTQLWSDEGLILDDSPRDVLDVAENCLSELVNRSLIQVVSKDRSEANVKTCSVHSILRELSRYKGESYKFVELRLDNERASSKSRGRRLSVQGDTLKHICSSEYDSSSARSLFLFNETGTCPFDETKYWKRVSESFRYVRVLYLWKVPIKLIPDRIENLIFLTNITILGIKKLEIDGISDFICNLEHLETIDIDGHVRKCLPEIWKMKKLRHLRVSKGLRLPKLPPKGLKEAHNLRILSGVVVEKNMAHSIFKGVKKLHLVYVANKQNQQVIDAAKQKVDEARKNFEKAQKRAESLRKANKAQKKITEAEKEVNKAQDKLMEAEGKTVEAQEFKLRTDALKSLKDFSALKSLKINGFEKFDENFDYKFPSKLEKITFVSSYLDVNYLISILEKLNNLRILKVREHYGSNVDQLRTGIESRFPTLKVSI